jgi:hypothetical protein
MSGSVAESRQSSQMPPIESATPVEADVTSSKPPTDNPELVVPTPEPTPVIQPHPLPQTLRLKVRGETLDAPRPATKRNGDQSSDLSELSEAEEAKVDALVEPALPQESTGVHHDDEGEPTHYEAGTLVWAKQGEHNPLHTICV